VGTLVEMAAFILLRIPSVTMVVLVVMALGMAHGLAHERQRSADRLEVDVSDDKKMESQFGLAFLSKAPAFAAVKAPPLLSIHVDKQSDVDVKSVAFEGATSLMVSANVKVQSLRLIPSAQAHGLTADEVPVAWAHYNNTVKKNGWGYLSIGATKDERISREVKMYAAGFLEGLVSAQQIRDFQHNANALIGSDEDRHHAMGNIRELFEKEANTIVHLSNMTTGATLSDANAPVDAWWRQARYALLQSWGMLDAYNRQVQQVKGTPMSMVDLLILNSDGETPELETAYDMEEALLRQSERENPGEDNDDGTKQSFLQRKVQHRSQPKILHSRAAREELRRKEIKNLNDKAWRKIKRATGRCSALVRVTQNNSDLMLGHTTFSDYSEMNRIFKYYDFPLGEGVAQKIGFSSYPGVAGSTDDYYITDTGLAVTETTISMLTDEPYDKLDDTGAKLPDFMRIMLSTRLAKKTEKIGQT
jgi:hypothetical protein